MAVLCEHPRRFNLLPSVADPTNEVKSACPDCKSLFTEPVPANPHG